MPRPKRVDVLTCAPGPSDAAVAEVWGNIDRVLVFANLHRDHPSDDARKVHHVLALISEAADRWYDGDTQPVTFKLPGKWPAGAVVALRNLVAMIRQGNPRIYVRLCPQCRQWFLTRDKRQHRKCHRETCFRAAEIQRAGDWQRNAQKKQKEAFASIKASRTR